jgi:ribosomal protein S18 acetylase RimI-like enzyme
MDCSHIQFRDRRSQIDLHQLQELFGLAAFWAKDRRVEDLAIALDQSDPVISAWDGSRLIGFARASSDRVYRATIWDVVVHPEYQGAGLGRKLVQTVISHPHVNRVERVYLMTTHQQSFYERIGFETNSSTTMVLFNQPIALPHPALPVELECDVS